MNCIGHNPTFLEILEYNFLGIKAQNEFNTFNILCAPYRNHFDLFDFTRIDQRFAKALITFFEV